MIHDAIAGPSPASGLHAESRVVVEPAQRVVARSADIGPSSAEPSPVQLRRNDPEVADCGVVLGRGPES